MKKNFRDFIKDIPATAEEYELEVVDLIRVYLAFGPTIMNDYKVVLRYKDTNKKEGQSWK